MKILVIDDKAYDPEHSRKFTLEMLRDSQSIDFELIEPTEKELTSSLDKIREYDLILVDYRFDKPGMFKSGASLYSLIRDYTNDTPIYLISVVRSRSNQFGDFDRFIHDKHLEKHAAFNNEMLGHIALKECNEPSKLIELLITPEEIKDELQIMLKPIFNKPLESENEDEIKSKDINGDLNIYLFHWLIQSLLYKEGPLVSRDGAALLLGIDSKYFDKISDKFFKAKYSGIFHESMDERWWGCLLEDLIFELDDPEDLLSNYSFKEASSKLLGASNNDDFSICVNDSCQKRYPDSLGTLAGDDSKTLYPVHVACSEFNESLTQEPFFRNPRLIIGEE